MKMKLATVFLATIMVAAILFPALTLAAPNPVSEVTVTVRPGDTLAGLCDQRNRFAASVWETQKCVDWVSVRNSLVNPDLIRVSEKLALPASDLAPEPAEVAKAFAEAAKLGSQAEAAGKAVKDQTSVVTGLEKQLAEAKAKLVADEKSAGELAAKAKAATEAAEKARAEAPKTQQTTVPPSAPTSSTSASSTATSSAATPSTTASAAVPSEPAMAQPQTQPAKAADPAPATVSAPKQSVAVPSAPAQAQPAAPPGPTKADVDAVVLAAVQPLTQRVSALEGQVSKLAAVTPLPVLTRDDVGGMIAAGVKAAVQPILDQLEGFRSQRNLPIWGVVVLLFLLSGGTLLFVRRSVDSYMRGINSQIKEITSWIVHHAVYANEPVPFQQPGQPQQEGNPAPQASNP